VSSAAKWLFRLSLVAMAMAMPAPAQPGAQFEIDYSNPGLRPAHWVLRFMPDGSGHFRSERGETPVDPSQGFEAANLDRDIQLSPEFASRVFWTVRKHRLFESGCESHMSVAFQGWKKLTYEGPDGVETCTFNFSKEKEIQALGDSLVAVATAIMEGARLESLLLHDRLGLDKETEYLIEATDDGRVQQICTIKGILERLAEDPQVMERVRKRAKVLLARGEG
jgi:hypothetical protein